MAKSIPLDPKDFKRRIEGALGEQLKQTVITAQKRLGSAAVSPIDTGRFRSSWFATSGRPSRSVASEGSKSPNTDANGLKIDPKETYYLTNNLPYAQRLCYEGWAVSKPKTWFVDFTATIPSIMKKAETVAKRKYDL